MQASESAMAGFRTENDSLGPIDVPDDKLWGVRTQRALQNFSIGHDMIPHELVAAYPVIKRAAAVANHTGGRLDDQAYELIRNVGDQNLGGEHHDRFPPHLWMTGRGTQFNINVNEVSANHCSAPPIARHEHDLTLKKAVQLGHLDAATFERVVDGPNGKGARRTQSGRCLGGRNSRRNNAETALRAFGMTSQQAVIEKDQVHGKQSR